MKLNKEFLINTYFVSLKATNKLSLKINCVQTTQLAIKESANNRFLDINEICGINPIATITNTTEMIKEIRAQILKIELIFRFFTLDVPRYLIKASSKPNSEIEPINVIEVINVSANPTS